MEIDSKDKRIVILTSTSTKFKRKELKYIIAKQKDEIKFSHILALHEFETTTFTRDQYFNFCNNICKNMIKLCEKHSKELNDFAGDSCTLSVPIRTNIYTDSMPYYSPNAHDYWLYYWYYIKEIRFTKRDFIAELLYLADHSLEINNNNELANLIVQQNKRYVYTVPSSGIYWNSVNQTHEDFLRSINDYKSKDNLLDALQETRRCKIEQVTRFCHKLIRYVRDFIEIGDLDIFGQDKMYKVMMMASIEKQEIKSIIDKFEIDSIMHDPNVDYYVNTSFTPTILLQNLVKDLSKNEDIFETHNKMVFVGKIVDLIQFINKSFREHLSNINARTFVEIKLY
jgi:hypothetical protein